MTLKEIEAEIKAILDGSEQKKAELQGRIETAEQGEREATTKASDAYKIGDVKAYHKAQDEIRHCKDAQRMFTDMLKDETERQLLGGEAYKSYLDKITAVLDASTNETRNKVLDLLNKIIAESEKNSAVIEEGNKLMHALQHDVMKDDACHVNARGERIPMVYLEKTYKDYEMAQLSGLIKENWLYKNLVQ